MKGKIENQFGVKMHMQTTENGANFQMMSLQMLNVWSKALIVSMLEMLDSYFIVFIVHSGETTS